MASGDAIAIIGGTGLTSLEGLEATEETAVDTPWGVPSGPVVRGRFAGRDVLFLARHGPGHTIPPHRVNYRANIWALKQLGVERVVAVAAVGGIHPAFAPAAVAIPDQIVDYTWSRAQTFHEDDLDEVVHIDFTEPYSARVRGGLVAAAADAGIAIVDWGTYGVTQGPRLESAAEIDRMERDGCHVVGMTGMPEAALAREAGLDYAHCAVVVNAAAGRGDGPITMDEIRRHLEVGMRAVHGLLASYLALELTPR